MVIMSNDQSIHTTDRGQEELKKKTTHKHKR